MITYRFAGQLCNVCLEIFTTFYYCKKFKLSYDNIQFPLKEYTRKGVEPNFIPEKKEFFLNIYNYFKDPYYSNIKDIPKYKYSDVIKNKIITNNIVFVPFSWENMDKDIYLLKDLFYNEKLYKDIFLKYSWITNKTIGVHVRRTDFSKYIPLNDTEIS
jgi:hypothetical protein